MGPKAYKEKKMLNFFKTNLDKELIKCLEGIEYGSIRIVLPSGEVQKYQGASAGPQCVLTIKDENFFSYLLDKGDIGLGESYIEDLWESDNISALIHFGILNKKALAKAIYGQAPSLILYKIKHLLKRNSKEGSKKNISFHYDLGNEFYKLWLDSTMTYSSAYWGEGEQRKLSLAEAQTRKYQAVLDSLKAKPGASILEIGCGWGGFAEFAASKGFHVTGLTLSEQQLAYAQERLAKQNLNAFTEFILRDYRDHKGQYDHVVSIEMLEAVGANYWDIYFKKIKSFLKPQGTLALQSIVIDEKSFDDYRKGTDFIQQYIFPGGMLPTIKVIQEYLHKNEAKESQYFCFGQDYARTLKEWDDLYIQNLAACKSLGYSESFLRMWHFYLNYCEGAFYSGQTDVTIISAKF